jgi:hypothetical protein
LKVTILLKIVDLALAHAWYAFPDSIRLNHPSKIDGGSEPNGFEVTKTSDMMQVATAKTIITIPRQRFLIALDYLLRHNHNRDMPCEIRSSFSAPGPLNLATQVNGVVTIMYILPILHQMGLVGIGSTRPATAWLATVD